ncbi:conserved hypothetical protein [Aeropyrum pernix K1]|uniref:DUF72 domain-containing protein n=1 Tax=Aeropyrum pernix (strain ATCC 700893 / DSM 11879 / JCM 9820 / NBRC 100138 / K1) TaxID=272557 RepID=Q9Y9V9_AERPE|nr:DUF72 domain-containing protein [Aeropyrum pernix]BAA81191.2 conserved hypothetical protein [Aeropyrum pernix K1]
MRVVVGTCGFQKSRKMHYKLLDAVEVQQTFYDPPPRSRLDSWRSEAPEDFEFTVKAWMLVTHGYNPRLWRRLKRRVAGDRSAYGGFKLTRENLWAWSVTLEAAEALKARIIVVQTPASFEASIENSERIVEFFNKAERGGFIIAWEPRGAWWENPNLLAETARKAGLVIAGDVLRGRLPPDEQELLYARLHGLGGGEVNYKYKYTDDDLKRLATTICGGLWSEAYVMFNNVYSFDDALRFKQVLREACKQ